MPAVKCRLCESENTGMLYALSFAEVFACRDCGVEFLHPLPPEETTVNIYDDGDKYYTETGVDYFNECFKGYSDDSVAIRDFRKTLDMLPIKSGALLDVGCAMGTFLDLARKRGFTVKGVELSKWASGYARNEFGLDVFTGTLEQAGFPSASFDVVTAFDVLEHVRDPMALLAEIKRVLKPGGVVFINTICHESILNMIAGALSAVTFGRAQWPLERLYGLHHLYYFSKPSLKGALERAGFDVAEVKSAEFTLERVDRLSLPMKIGMWVVYRLQKITGMENAVLALAVLRKPAKD